MNFDLTIITVNKNNHKGLINTLASIRNLENNRKMHHLIVDGNSQDLPEDFNQLQSRFNFDYISEVDFGIYNAMNKGIVNVSSDYVVFLNSGDSFYNYKSLEILEQNLNNLDLVYGDIMDLGQSSPVLVTYPNKLSLEYMLCGGLPHQATVIKKNLFNKVGLYNENYKIISDWVFFMEALFFHNATYKHVPYVISNFEGGGISSKSVYIKQIVYEQMDYISKRFPQSMSYYCLNSPYVKKYLRQKPRFIRWFFKFIILKFNKVY